MQCKSLFTQRRIGLKSAASGLSGNDEGDANALHKTDCHRSAARSRDMCSTTSGGRLSTHDPSLSPRDNIDSEVSGPGLHGPSHLPDPLSPQRLSSTIYVYVNDIAHSFPIAE